MMIDIEKEVVAWHLETFPNATFSAVREKLREEIDELREVLVAKDLDFDAMAEEIADIAIVSIAMLGRGFHGRTLSGEIIKKMAVNRIRKWGPENAEGDRPREK